MVMSACPIFLKYRNKQKSTLLCLWNICVFFTVLTLGRSQCSWARTFFPAAFVIFFSLFSSLCITPFLSFLKPQKKKKIVQKYGAVNQISRLELWMGEHEIRHRARGVSADVFEDRYMAYVLWKAIPVTNPLTYPYSDAECQRNPVLQKRLPPIFGNGSRPLLNRLVEQNAFAFQGSGYSCAAVLSKRFVWFGVRQKI